MQDDASLRPLRPTVGTTTRTQGQPGHSDKAEVLTASRDSNADRRPLADDEESGLSYRGRGRPNTDGGLARIYGSECRASRERPSLTRHVSPLPPDAIVSVRVSVATGIQLLGGRARVPSERKPAARPTPAITRIEGPARA